MCGNSIVGTSESCDDGNLIDGNYFLYNPFIEFLGDGCSSSCTLEQGWRCEGHPSVCIKSQCGDGVISMYEDCDDKNTENGDGCSKECYLEKGWTCDGAPSQCSLIKESNSNALIITIVFICLLVIFVLYKVTVWYKQYQQSSKDSSSEISPKQKE